MSRPAKLTAEQVADIRKRAEAGPRGINKWLAMDYGVSQSAISLIVNGKIWNKNPRRN
jgi:hypothetical protein